MRFVDTEMAKCADDESDIIIGNGVPLFVIKVTETNRMRKSNKNWNY